jgi:isocitrate/isopropylmalate dehydrogenase
VAGQDEASEVLMEAVENVLEQGIKTRDLGGQSGTEEVTDRVCQEIEKIGKEKALGAETVK